MDGKDWEGMTSDGVFSLLHNTEIARKARENKLYAQNLYAALCNMRWQVAETFPILAEKGIWSVSWRGAGGIVARLRGEGDYMDWYCSGMESDYEPSERVGIVPEGTVTDEIKADMLQLGFIPNPWPDND